MKAMINGYLYEVEPEVKMIIDQLMIENEQLHKKIEKLNDALTIDAEHVKHAQWIDKTTWFGALGSCKYVCSNCGYAIFYDPKSRGDGRGGNYCDDCGAKMDGGVGDENNP